MPEWNWWNCQTWLAVPEESCYCLSAAKCPEGAAWSGGPTNDRLLVFTNQVFSPAHKLIQKISVWFSCIASSHTLWEHSMCLKQHSFINIDKQLILSCCLKSLFLLEITIYSTVYLYWWYTRYFTNILFKTENYSFHFYT